MPKYSKESLEKLLVLIDEICKEEENLWFKDEIQKKYSIVSLNKHNPDESLNRIYEYCIKEIIEKQAIKFYEDFKLDEIKPKLIEDFIRMEHFRRDDNFEDFCLAMFQQIENIVIYTFNSYRILEKIKDNNNQYLISTYNKDLKKFTRSTYGITLGRFIFQKYKLDEPFNIHSQTWYFLNKLRSILYYFYFNSQIEFNTTKFEHIYQIANELYQVRNLNHRGGEKSEFQQKIFDEIIPKHNKYYFKFLGFLEDFVSATNKNLISMD
ncbi:hypothetical protein FVB9288_02307 [Flavobacterium sp. CECT 9288]|uniref:hypothetical protein n=1 Tax=Flavobacterium sp. CECT 9288 TaxID=2845819 RepID=UPI001E4D972A|nr:hypothetical protein [Flavobacterium sp. CECT 9288]CAH0336599.1 hypothetical protein FVB9288_02307 [Flavobacterium sp. CECT 9288]